eukprot:6701727-Prymnesium_polylepis.2
MRPAVSPHDVSDRLPKGGGKCCGVDSSHRKVLRSITASLCSSADDRHLEAAAARDRTSCS